MKTHRTVRNLGLAALLVISLLGCTKEEETRWPAVSLEGPARAMQDAAVTFTLDIVPGSEPLVEASLDFDGNGSADTVLTNPPAGRWTVTYAFPAPGWPFVKGRVLDAAGRRVTDSVRVGIYRGAPPRVEIVAPITAVDTAAVRFIVTDGGYPRGGFAYSLQGNGCQWASLDSSALSDTVRLWQGLLRETGPSEQVVITARVWDDHGQTDSARVLLYVVGQVLRLYAMPDYGHAPLSTVLRLIHRPYGQYSEVRLGWRTDSTWDTTYVPDRDTLSLPVRYDSIGSYVVRAELRRGAETLQLADTVRAW